MIPGNRPIRQTLGLRKGVRSKHSANLYENIKIFFPFKVINKHDTVNMSLKYSIYITNTLFHKCALYYNKCQKRLLVIGASEISTVSHSCKDSKLI